MCYYLVVFIAGLIFAFGLIFSRNIFFSLVENTISLLDVIIETNDSATLKQKKLTKNLLRVILFLLKVFLVLGLIIVLSIAPIILYTRFTNLIIEDLDLKSFYFYFSLSIGSLIPFIIFGKLSKKKDYSDWSTLLHRITLNNYNISRSLFSIEKKIFKSKLSDLNKDFIIISGLARSGTTSLTKLLFQSNKFHSLSYSNMPFLLCPNIWKKFYNPKTSNLRERSHGDKVMFGYNTVEAMEEFFWKVFLNDNFIQEDYLIEHEVEPDIYENYIHYQKLLKPKDTKNSIYLAKNNNFILRYKSIRKLNANFKIILLFRDPVHHAYSLLQQHLRYIQLQGKDGFIAEYMNWLGHHEFGTNHKYFKLSQSIIDDKYDTNSINYWLRIWINYYTMILDLEDDENLILVDYEDFLTRPNELIGSLENKIGIKLNLNNIEKFNNKKTIDFEIDSVLKKKSYEIQERLIANKLTISAAKY